MTWWDIACHWEHVQADLQEHYGLCEPLIQDHPWPWFRTIVHRLADIPDSRMAHVVRTITA